MLKLAHKGHRTAICMAAQSIPLGSPGMIKRERARGGVAASECTRPLAVETVPNVVHKLPSRLRIL